MQSFFVNFFLSKTNMKFRISWQHVLTKKNEKPKNLARQFSSIAQTKIAQVLSFMYRYFFLFSIILSYYNSNSMIQGKCSNINNKWIKSFIFSALFLQIQIYFSLLSTNGHRVTYLTGRCKGGHVSQK